VIRSPRKPKARQIREFSEGSNHIFVLLFRQLPTAEKAGRSNTGTKHLHQLPHPEITSATEELGGKVCPLTWAKKKIVADFKLPLRRPKK
jgi:hypothetical protein